MSTRYHESWNTLFSRLFATTSMKRLSAYVQAERQKYKVFPPANLVFNAFCQTPMDNVKVVILGQDPYHNDGQAHGLSFSVPSGIIQPPSLKNIFKELSDDIPGFKIPFHGDLTGWARQGVLLLNATLTVRAHEAGSHQGVGWEQFTDEIISTLSKEYENIVFLLWGSYATRKVALIDGKKHLILTSAHPSPLSVYRGFWGCKHFSKANEYLIKHDKQSIDWQV